MKSQWLANLKDKVWAYMGDSTCNHEDDAEWEDDEDLVEPIPQRKQSITIMDQFAMIRAVSLYESSEPGTPKQESWEIGYRVHSNTRVVEVEDDIQRAQLEMFWQDPQTGEQMKSCIYEMIRFPNEDWHILCAKK